MILREKVSLSVKDKSAQRIDVISYRGSRIIPRRPLPLIEPTVFGPRRFLSTLDETLLFIDEDDVKGEPDTLVRVHPEGPKWQFFKPRDSREYSFDFYWAKPEKPIELPLPVR